MAAGAKDSRQEDDMRLVLVCPSVMQQQNYLPRPLSEDAGGGPAHSQKGVVCKRGTDIEAS